MISTDTSVTTGAAPIDVLESELIILEALIARARARQAEVLTELDVAQVAAVDGARSMLEWTAARLDVTHDTARLLTMAAKCFAEHADVLEAVQNGAMTFDRALATMALIASGADQALVDASAGLDLAGVRRLANRHKRVRRVDEAQAYRERYLATQSSLDGLAGRFWGQLPGFELRLFEKAIEQRADMFRDLPGPSADAGARRADALVSIAQDSLDGRDGDGEGPGAADPLLTSSSTPASQRRTGASRAPRSSSEPRSGRRRSSASSAAAPSSSSGLPTARLWWRPTPRGQSRLRSDEL